MPLFSHSQMEILAQFLMHPGEDIQYGELAERLGKAPGAFQRSITSLQEEGYLSSAKRGNQRHFVLNTSHPLLPEVDGIVRKTIGCEALLRNAVAACPEIATAFIYGSYAQNRLSVHSDIDLLVVLDGTDIPDSLLKEVDLIERKLARPINHLSYGIEEYDRKIRESDPFLAQVLSGPIIKLKGEP